MNTCINTLKKCLLDSTLKEIKEIEELDYSFITADEDFRTRVKNDVKKSSSVFKSKRLFLILVAVLVTLCLMMSISAIRTPIIDFFVEIYGTFSSLFVKVEEPSTIPTTIEVEYQPSYFEENGYEITEHEKYNSIVDTTWKRDSFVVNINQCTINYSNQTANTENGIYDTVYIGDCKVFYTKELTSYSAYWIQDGYYFSLHCYSSMDWSEVEKIISSTGPVTP
ncbi:MAG: hypothetical protein IJ400_04960 [Clostridia bacterium]|nr:hypothetical protein [Clostridia bacterium]